MIDERDIDSMIKASPYFHELFKKTILATPPAEVVTKTQMDILLTLYADGPMSMSALSSHVNIAPEQTTRAIKNLRERDLVESDRDEDNRRMVIARLSEKGTLLLDDHTRELHANLRASLEGLTDEEVAQLAETARTATRLLEKTGFRHVVTDPKMRK